MTSSSSIPGLTPIPLTIGGRQFPSRFFLAPLAGYTQLAFRIALRELGGLGLATTDLVQAAMLAAEKPKSLQLVATAPEDRPLSVQIFGGRLPDLLAGARWLQDHGYEGIDLNMGCPMAKVNGSGGGARLMCDRDGAVRLVEAVIDAVDVPVTVKMRLGWDSQNITSPELAAAFRDVGVAAVTIHGRTRAQGFHGGVDRDGIRATVEQAHPLPVIANGDVRRAEEALSMLEETGAAGVAIGRGAMLDPWIFRKLQNLETGQPVRESTAEEQIGFLRRHFALMHRQHDDYACILFRKFAAWYGVRLGIPDDLEDRLRRFESPTEFDQIAAEIEDRHGERACGVPTALIKTPNGPVSHW